MSDDKANGSSRDTGGGVAQAARTWVDVLIRVLIVAAVAVVLVWPSAFPVLKRFALTSGKVNIMGSEFDIVELALFKGVTVDGGKLLLQGVDVNTLYDSNQQLIQANKDFATQNADLKTQLDRTAALLEQVKQQRDDANQQLVALQSAQHPARPIDTAHLDTQIAAVQLSTKQLESVTSAVKIAAQVAQMATQQAAETGGTTPPAAIVFGAVKDRDKAAENAAKARDITDAPIALYARGGFVRTVAGFPSREDAIKILPKFHEIWDDAYVVDTRAWCPAAVVTAAGTDSTPSQIDCKF